MATIWSETRDGVHYEVRAAGRTRRLYTDGVFHSSYNPTAPVTGGVWDMLMMPAFFYPPGSIRRVLLLGVGGGTVIQQLRRFVRPEKIVAVDINPTHLEIARRFFDAAGPDVELIEADACDWLRRDTSRYALVIDDLFGGRDGEPERAIDADAAWCTQLARRLRTDGAISINCISPSELAATGFLEDAALRERFPSRFQLRAARDSNAVGMFLPFPAKAGELRRQLMAVPGFDPRREARLDFSVRSLA